MLGEHGERTHGFFVYQSTLRIPLIAAGPGVPTRRVPGLARTADVTPTILRLLGLDPLPQIDGTDLFAAGRPRESYAETWYPRSLGWSPLHSYRVGSQKLIDAPRPELYDLSGDPHEQRDLASGTSSRSSKLVHGGLRYLEMFDFALVKEALHTILVPRPTTARVGGQPLRDTAVLTWASDLMRGVLLDDIAAASGTMASAQHSKR